MDSKQKETFCVRGHPMSNTIDIIGYENVSPKTQKVVKVKKIKCDISDRNKSQILTN